MSEDEICKCRNCDHDIIPVGAVYFHYSGGIIIRSCKHCSCTHPERV